ncbi:MAG: tetratricopeptide repeat protein [Myxococcota bacterium]
MLPRNLRFISVSLFAVALLAAPPIYSQSADSPARVQYARALEAMKNNQWAEARQLLLELWQKSRTFDVAASLGQCEFKLGQYAAGAEHMKFAVENAPPTEDPVFIERYNVALAELKKRVATLHVTVNQPTARISIDGALAETPTFPAELFVGPGPHTVTATVSGTESSRNIEAAAGASYDLEFVLSPPRAITTPVPVTPARDSAAPQNTPQATNAGSGPSVVPLVSGAAIAVTGLTLGIVETIRAADAKDRMSTLRDQTASAGSSACVAPQTIELQAQCSQQYDAAGTYHRARNWAAAGFVVAGAATAFTLSYWFWPRSTSQPAQGQASRVRTVSFIPAATPREFGLLVQGSFE